MTSNEYLGPNAAAAAARAFKAKGGRLGHAHAGSLLMEVERLQGELNTAMLGLAAVREAERRAPETESRQPDGYKVFYGEGTYAFAGSLNDLLFENLATDGIPHTVVPLYASSPSKATAVNPSGCICRYTHPSDPMCPWQPEKADAL